MRPLSSPEVTINFLITKTLDDHYFIESLCHQYKAYPRELKHGVLMIIIICWLQCKKHLNNASFSLNLHLWVPLEFPKEV